MIEKIQALPEELGRTEHLLADSGYLSQANVEHCAAAKIEPLSASAIMSVGESGLLPHPKPRPPRRRRCRRWRTG
jgi:IS5 family transposase